MLRGGFSLRSSFSPDPLAGSRTDLCVSGEENDRLFSTVLIFEPEECLEIQ